LGEEKMSDIKMELKMINLQLAKAYQSERQARFQVKKELEDLQDAIANKFLYDPMDPDKFKILMNAMKQSMERAKQ
jgi:hypothetical protein